MASQDYQCRQAMAGRVQVQQSGMPLLALQTCSQGPSVHSKPQRLGPGIVPVCSRQQHMFF